MKIEIHEIVTQQPNGDRDTQRHPCYGFKVVLFNGKKRSVLFENDQFDSFHCHINGTRKEFLGEAQKKAAEFSETLGCEVNLDPRKDIYAGLLWAKLAEDALGIRAEDVESAARTVARHQARQLMIILGVIGHPGYDMRIGHDAGEWVLATGKEDSYEELARHEDWKSFIELVAEYSDYVEGQDE